MGTTQSHFNVSRHTFCAPITGTDVNNSSSNYNATARTDIHEVHNQYVDASGNDLTPINEPPKLKKTETMDEKFWRKFREQPLVPIGCAATVYFFVSGVRSFQANDPVRSQRMMRGRVAAQFFTLICFVGYMGLDKCDFRLAPAYQDFKKAQAQSKAEQEK